MKPQHAARPSHLRHYWGKFYRDFFLLVWPKCLRPTWYPVMMTRNQMFHISAPYFGMMVQSYKKRLSPGYTAEETLASFFNESFFQYMQQFGKIEYQFWDMSHFTKPDEPSGFEFLFKDPNSAILFKLTIDAFVSDHPRN